MEVLPLQTPLEESYNFLKELQDKKYKEMNALTQLYSDLCSKEKQRDNEIKFIEQENKFSKSELDRIEKEIGSLKNINGNPYSNMILGKQEKLNAKEILLAHSKAMLSVLQEDQQYLSFWKKGFHKSGIPNMKVEGFLASLEDRTNNYLSSISDRMFVEIDSQRDLKSGGVKEEIAYRVHNPDKDITDYHSYSGGERQRVKIANILAFSDLLGQMDIMILDEVLELSLDEDGKTSVMDLLREKANSIGTIFVVTHSDVMKEKLDSVIRIRKNDGVSEIY
jgi:DNA repair exonuclease SbcCD ATPase subunit